MDDFNNILDQFKNADGELKSNLHIFEEMVPIEEQMVYFDYSKKIRKENQYVDRNRMVAFLFSPGIDLEEKKFCLVMLAGIVDITAYRAIETYHSSPLEPELKNWSALALMESRILIDSDLSGQQQYLISTGLGGAHGKLRFFTAVASKDRSNFNQLQQEITEREFRFTFEHYKIQIEEIVIQSNYIKILVLSDINHDIKGIIHAIIKECNELGDFLDDRFILTNLKYFKDEELEKLLTP